MSNLTSKESRIFAVENGLAALLFLFLFTSEAVAHLLTAFPSHEVLWRLAIATHRLASPLTGVIGHRLDAPYLFLCALAVAVSLPLLAYRSHSWFGSAVCGHVALAAFVVMIVDTYFRARVGREFASLSQVIDSRTFDTSMITLLAVTAAMAGLCILNHITFFARVSRKQK